MDRKSRAAALTGRECRRTASAQVEVREDGDGKLAFKGYASVFDAPYDMGWYTEVVRQGAFSKTLGEGADVQLLINHEGLPLARTVSGTLKLTQDSTGLLAEAALDPNDPDVQRLAPKMARGDIDEMSFAFYTIRQEWSPDYEERALVELSINKGDVSVVNYGANPATAGASLRHLDKLYAQRDRFAAALTECRAGKALSAATVSVLSDLLDTLAACDENLDAADVLIDDAQAALADLLGVPNPDVDDVQTNSFPLDLALATARSLSLRVA